MLWAGGLNSRVFTSRGTDQALCMCMKAISIVDSPPPQSNVGQITDKAAHTGDDDRVVLPSFLANLARIPSAASS